MRSFVTSSILSISFVAGCGGQNLDDITPFTTEHHADTNVTTAGMGHIVIRAHSKCVYDVVFSPDGSQIATCSLDRTLRLWEVHSGKYLRGFKTAGSVLAVAFSPDGHQLLVTTIDHGVHLFDTATWKSSIVARAEDLPQVIEFSEDGKLLAVGTSPVELLRSSDYRRIGVLRGHEEGGDTLAFSNDGKTLVSGNADHTAKVWEVAERRLRFDRKHDYWVGGVDVSPDGRQIITSSFKRDNHSQTVEIAFLDSKTGDVEDTIIGETLRGHTPSATRVRFSPDGRFLVSLLYGAHDTGQIRDDMIITQEEGNISIRDVQTKRLMAKSTSHKKTYRIGLSPDSKTLAVADVEGMLELWDVDAFIAKHQVLEERGR